MGFEPRLKAMQMESATESWQESRTKIKQYEEEMEAKRRADFFSPNMKNMKLLDTLGKVNPAYAKHMLTKNDLLKAFAFVSGGGIDIMKQPICERCEMPATWGTFDQTQGEVACTCACGHVTKNPMTFEQYALEYLKGVDELTLNAIRPKLSDVIDFIDKSELDRLEEKLCLLK